MRSGDARGARPSASDSVERLFTTACQVKCEAMPVLGSTGAMAIGVLAGESIRRPEEHPCSDYCT